MQLKIGWRGVLELAGLFRLRTRTFGARNSQAVSADAVFCFLDIFVENEWIKMQSKLDKYNIFNFNAHVAESWLY